MTAEEIATEDGAVITVRSFKAWPVTPDRPVATTALIFDHEPRSEVRSTDSLTEIMKMYADEGDRVERVLFATLPGGLYDQILRAMLTRKASLLRIRHSD